MSTGFDILYRYLERFENAVIEIGKPTHVPLSAVKKLVKVRRVIAEALDERREVMNKIVQDCGSLDENGNLSISPDKFGWDAAQASLKELDYTTVLHVDVEPFKSSELDGWYTKKTFANYANILFDLRDFVVDDESESESEE